MSPPSWSPPHPECHRRCSTPRSRTLGLSLIELCVVLALSALVLTLVVPGFGSLIERQRLRGSAAELAAELQWLRIEALVRNEALRFSLHATADGSCTVVHTGAREHCRCEDTGPARCEDGAVALKTSHWPLAERVAVQANVGSMLFDPGQGTTTPTGSVRLTDSEGRGITHVVNILGRVRSCSPEGRVPGYRAC
jgi:type IV fimbrial biogenesis protein FimT